MVGFKPPALKCKWQVLAPLCLLEHPPGSFMRLQALSSQLWPRFSSFSARLQRQGWRREQGEEAHWCLCPRWAGRPGLCIFQPRPFEPGGWEGGAEDQVKRGPSPPGAGGSCSASWERSNHPLCFVPSTSIRCRGAWGPFFPFFFSFQPRGTFLRLGAENIAHLLRFCFMSARTRAHPSFVAGSPRNLAFSGPLGLKSRNGLSLPMLLSVNERRASLLSESRIPSFHLSILSREPSLGSLPSVPAVPAVPAAALGAGMGP